MFNLKEFIVTNIVNGIKNGTFTKEYGNIMAVNYFTKGLITEEEIISIDAQITEWDTVEEEMTETEVFEESELENFETENPVEDEKPETEEEPVESTEE